jgi:hypothetical protein
MHEHLRVRLMVVAKEPDESVNRVPQAIRHGEDGGCVLVQPSLATVTVGFGTSWKNEREEGGQGSQ